MADNRSDTSPKGMVAEIAEDVIDMGLAALEAVKDGMVVAIADLNAEWMTEAQASAKDADDEATGADTPADH